MKRVTTILFAIVISTGLFAQSGEKLSYQAVIRNTDNTVVADANVGIQISVLKGDAYGPPVYMERQNTMTNSYGLMSIKIGGEAAESQLGSFTGIDWSDGPYFLKTETDPRGGSNYIITGTTELLSVPYALHARTADRLSHPMKESDPHFKEWLSENESRLYSGGGGTSTSSQLNNISLSIFGAGIDGGTTRHNGFGPHSGIKMKRGETSSFHHNFTVPQGYTTGSPIKIKITCSNSSVGNISLLPNAISIARKNEGFIIGQYASSGLEVLDYPIKFANADVPIEITAVIESPDPNYEIQAGDAITFSFYRSSAEFYDTSYGTLSILGMEVEFEETYSSGGGSGSGGTAGKFDEISRDEIIAFEGYLGSGDIPAIVADERVVQNGDIIVFKTDQGNYGKFEVVDIDMNNLDQLTINAVTYAQDGSVLKSGELVINGTWTVDFDTFEIGTTPHDMHWRRLTDTETNFSPSYYGAKLGLYK